MEAMLSNGLEVLDANIVILFEEPPRQNMSIAWFEEGKFASLMQKPTISQGLTVDPTAGTTLSMYQIESMRSQKIINLSALRIEVHDRSGEPDLEKAQIPETIAVLVNALHVESAKAIGANCEITFKLPEEDSASAVIAEKLLQKNFDFLPQHITPIGGTARLYLSDHSGTIYTLAFEPRGQDTKTNDLRMTCNANVSKPEDLSIERLRETFQQCYKVLFHVKESLFPASRL
jgi:hypothetical protein